MAVISLKPIKPVIWIPPKHSTIYKITVERADGTIDDITDLIEYCVVEDLTTSGIGKFEFSLPNPNNVYTTAWTGMEIFRYYKDYGSSATTLVFIGRIEKPSKTDNSVSVKGRGEAVFVIEEQVTQSHSGIDAGVIIKSLFDAYGDGRFNTSSIPLTTGKLITLTWYEMPFYTAIEEVCVASGYDCYVDASLVVRFFEQGSRENVIDGIVHDYNLLETGDFAPDLKSVKNKIRVYGAVIDGAQIVYTANDSASQTAYGIRRSTISDSNITNETHASELAEYTLANQKDPPIVGEVKSLLLAAVRPGDNLWISDPNNGLYPAKRRVIKYKDEIRQRTISTTVTINKEPLRISHVVKDTIERDNASQDSTNNPYDLDYSHVELFNEDSGTHDDTEITGGALKISSGSTGMWISPVITTINDVTEVYVKLIGTALAGIKIYVSANNGITWELIQVQTDTILSTSIGKNLLLKLELNSSTTEIASYMFQYKTQ